MEKPQAPIEFSDLDGSIPPQFPETQLPIPPKQEVEGQPEPKAHPDDDTVAQNFG